MSKHPLYNYSGLQKDNHPQVMYALVDKRAELDGERIEVQRKLLELEYNIKVIDDSIKIFDTELNILIKPKKVRQLPDGGFSAADGRSLVISILKSKEKPILRSELFNEIALCQDVDMNNGNSRQRLKNTIAQQISKLVKDGKIIENKIGNRRSLYEIKRYF